MKTYSPKLYRDFLRIYGKGRLLTPEDAAIEIGEIWGVEATSKLFEDAFEYLVQSKEASVVPQTAYLVK